MTKRTWFAIGAVFFTTLIANTPTPFIYSLVQKKLAPAGIDIQGLQGNVLNGQIGSVSKNNQALMQNVNYKFKPTELLLGRMAYQLNSTADQIHWDGTIAKTLGGIKVSAFDVNGSLKQLAASAGTTYLPIDATVVGHIHSLSLSDGKPEEMSAKFDVKNAAWKLAATPIPLGNFLADIDTENQIIIAKISSPSGPLETKGDAKIFPDHHYEIDLLVKLKPDAPAMLTNVIASLGPPDAQGYSHIQQKGKL